VLPTLELAAKRKAQLYGYLEAIGQRLDLTETQYERAQTSYEAVGAWLIEAESPHLQDGSISPHGSIRIQTANRPFVPNSTLICCMCFRAFRSNRAPRR